MKVLMLGNGFDLYHNLLSHYDDFMTIGEYLCQKHSVINHEDLDKTNIYLELFDLAESNETIRNKLHTYEEEYKKTIINKIEYADYLEKLHTNCWFKHFLDVKNRDGWVALESQVSEVLKAFRQNNINVLEPFLDALKEKHQYSDAIYRHIKMYLPSKLEDDDFIFDQYTQFVEMLKLYLKIFVNSVLPSISYIYRSCNDHFKNNDYILSFNYTSTYAKLYDSTAEIIHVHGKLDDELVLGVNSDEYDAVANNDCRFIKYKKYYQRITKHTIDDLKDMINQAKLTAEPKVLSVVGHSLDVSDEDIITVLFDLFECIVIFFHNDGALDQYIKNLKLIFGAKELSKMTFSQKIIFQKLPPNEFSR